MIVDQVGDYLAIYEAARAAYDNVCIGALDYVIWHRANLEAMKAAIDTIPDLLSTIVAKDKKLAETYWKERTLEEDLIPSCPPRYCGTCMPGDCKHRDKNN